jgi:hypothetical protein
MVKINYDGLFEAIESFKGKNIVIHESLSRVRSAGNRSHDRHFATKTRFSMNLEDVTSYFDGLHLSLESIEGFMYQISIMNIVVFEMDDQGVLKIIEQFEKEIERLTEISIAG